MRKSVSLILLLLVSLLTACGNNETHNASNDDGNTNHENKNVETITYQSEAGPIEVPAEPKRVIVFHPFAGHVLASDVNVVGVDTWAKQNPRFQDKLTDAEEITDDSLEKIIELEPDLILGLSSMKNFEKLSEIAPTVTFTYGKLDYLTQFLEISKVLNKEEEANTWIADFKNRAQTVGKEIKDKIGADATVTIIENFNKELYVYGESFGRGGEVLYQAMGLNMPAKVEEMALEPGYYALSLEVLPEYVGDYLIVNKNQDEDTAFLQSETYQNIPAVQNKQVFEVNAKEFFFNDPITLDYQLEFFKESFLENYFLQINL